MKMRITSATQDKKWLKIKKKVSPTMKEEEDATGYTMWRLFALLHVIYFYYLCTLCPHFNTVLRVVE